MPAAGSSHRVLGAGGMGAAAGSRVLVAGLLWVALAAAVTDGRRSRGRWLCWGGGRDMGGAVRLCACARGHACSSARGGSVSWRGGAFVQGGVQGVADAVVHGAQGRVVRLCKGLCTGSCVQ